MNKLISILFVMMIVGCGKSETKTETEITEKKVVGTWVTETRHGRYNRYTTLILKATIKPSSDKNASSNVIKRMAGFPHGFPGSSAAGEWWVEDGQVWVTIENYKNNIYGPPEILMSVYRIQSDNAMRRIKRKQDGDWVNLSKAEQAVFKKIK